MGRRHRERHASQSWGRKRSWPSARRAVMVLLHRRLRLAALQGKGPSGDGRQAQGAGGGQRYTSVCRASRNNAQRRKPP